MPDDAAMTPMQQAVIALQAQRARIVELEQAATAPIAVIGMACRYPADSTSPAALWDAVREGRDGSREVPADRWDVDALYDPTPGRPGKMYVRQGCFIEDVDQFEPLFFRISPREAVGIDPQQRLLLETTWQALEDAAIPPPSLVGSQTGVFRRHQHQRLFSAAVAHRAWLRQQRHRWLGQCRERCVWPIVLYVRTSRGRAWRWIPRARRRWWRCIWRCRRCAIGSAALALAAGVNLMLTPDVTVNFCQGRMLAADGRCKTFDAAADGYVRGEGCGVLVLKRLSDADGGGRPRAGGDPRHGGEPGRPQRRPDGAERPGAGGGDPRGPGQRRDDRRTRSTTSRRTAPAPRWAIRSRCTR